MPSIPSLRLHWLLVAASLVVPAGLFIAAAVHDRATVLEEAQDAIIRSVSVMHEHARKVLETAELALARVNDRVDDLNWQQIAAPETSAFLSRLKAPLEQAVAIWVTDAQGVIRAGSQGWKTSSMVVAKWSAILKASGSEGSKRPRSIEMTVWRVMPSASAHACCDNPAAVRSS